MSNFAVSEREALMARVAELEARMAVPTDRPGGSVVEQMWHYVLAFVPGWIIGAGVVIFAAFHGWQYYTEAQGLAVDTRLKAAKAAVEKAKADAANTNTSGDMTIRVASFRAEVEKKQQEAARLKIELDAQNTLVENESLKVQGMRAEVAKKQAEAGRAHVVADAAMQREGLQTLEEKAATTKLVYTEIDAIKKNVQGIFTQVILGQPGGRARLVNAICSNAYAEFFGCPANYVRQFRRGEPSVRPQAAPSAVAPRLASVDRYGASPSGEIKVRKCAEFSARCPEFERLPQGRRVKIVRDAGNGWLEVETRPGVHGFVNSRYLAVE